VKLIATFLLMGALLHSGEYLYKFDASGAPKMRTNAHTGAVEVYTNIEVVKASESVLHRIHTQSYSSMSYESFLQAMLQRYPDLKFQRTSNEFRWLTHNDYLHIESLPKIDSYIAR